MEWRRFVTYLSNDPRTLMYPLLSLFEAKKHQFQKNVRYITNSAHINETT